MKQQTRIDDLKEKPGIAGVWLDSWDIPNHYKFVNYAKSPAVPTVERAMNYIAELQERGYLVLVEGQSPVALDSFWYQTEKYEPMVGNEFCFSGMSPFASNEDGLLTSDLFRLLAYGCAMFQDIRLLSDANNKVTKLAKECNKMMNSIHEKLGMPQRIREMSIAAIDGHSPVVLVQECKEDIEHAPIGTFWECKKGIAIFGLRTAQQLRIDLPSRVQGDFSVEQYDVRLNQGTTKMKLRTDDKRAYLEGRLFSGGVVILKRI